VDNDIKLMIAADKGIEISVDELERVNEQVRRGELNFDIPRPQPQTEPEEDEDAEFTAMMDMVAEDDDDE
jgi:HAMP domain-containing protein